MIYFELGHVERALEKFFDMGFAFAFLGLHGLVFGLVPVVCVGLTVRWWRGIPAERRRVQYQIAEIIASWFILSVPIAVMCGRGRRMIGLDGDEFTALGSLLGGYMILGAVAGWTYARHRTGGVLPRGLVSAGWMLIGSVIPPAAAGYLVAGMIATVEGGFVPGFVAFVVLPMIALIGIDSHRAGPKRPGPTRPRAGGGAGRPGPRERRGMRC